MTEVEAVVQNEAGIHCRPTALITQAATVYDGTVSVQAPSGSCELGSALDLMMLGLEKGTQVTLRVDGPDEQNTAEQFRELFERNFDFPGAGEGG
jgi:phosphocarrier protein HPr